MSQSYTVNFQLVLGTSTYLRQTTSHAEIRTRIQDQPSFLEQAAHTLLGSHMLIKAERVYMLTES